MAGEILGFDLICVFNMNLTIEEPWEVADEDEFYFYHCFKLNDGGTIDGDWDISFDFENYIGNVDLCGKKVLDMGTATGYIAFAAEELGAREVTALDIPSLADEDRVPFRDFEYTLNKEQWATKYASYLERGRKGFWHVWNRKNSKVRVAYCTMEKLLSIDERFDVVIAGALLEHLGDPIKALGACCRLADKTVVIAFTPVDFDRGEFMRPLIPWTHSDLSYVWWVLSRDLYERVFENLGFKPEFRTSKAVRIGKSGERSIEERTTIVAHRIS